MPNNNRIENLKRNKHQTIDSNNSNNSISYSQNYMNIYRQPNFDRKK